MLFFSKLLPLNGVQLGCNTLYLWQDVPFLPHLLFCKNILELPCIYPYFGGSRMQVSTTMYIISEVNILFSLHIHCKSVYTFQSIFESTYFVTSFRTLWSALFVTVCNNTSDNTNCISAHFVEHFLNTFGIAGLNKCAQIYSQSVLKYAFKFKCNKYPEQNTFDALLEHFLHSEGYKETHYT